MLVGCIHLSMEVLGTVATLNLPRCLKHKGIRSQELDMNKVYNSSAAHGPFVASGDEKNEPPGRGKLLLMVGPNCAPVTRV
jgi:hypothetical protein